MRRLLEKKECREQQREGSTGGRKKERVGITDRRNAVVVCVKDRVGIEDHVGFADIRNLEHTNTQKLGLGSNIMHHNMSLAATGVEGTFSLVEKRGSRIERTPDAIVNFGGAVVSFPPPLWW